MLSELKKILNRANSCFIPECEEIEGASFIPNWLQDAVPFANGKPAACNRYQTDSFTTECGAGKFNQSNIHRCDQFIFETREKSILNEVSLFENCERNRSCVKSKVLVEKVIKLGR